MTLRPAHHGIAARVAATFVSVVLRNLIALAGGMIMARGLGAAAYGDLNFLLTSFGSISMLLDMGASTGFYTLLSRRPRPRVFFLMYFGWLAAQFLLTSVAVGVIMPEKVLHLMWVGHDRKIVLLSLLAFFLSRQAWPAFAQAGEASRRTVLVQAISLAQSLVHLGLIYAAARHDWLSVSSVLWLLAAESAALVLLMGKKLLRGASSADGATLSECAGELLRYCRPLILYNAVGFVYAYLDTWLLQRFGGSIQQGYFAISSQLSFFGQLTTSALVGVFWKETAEALERGEDEFVRRFYDIAGKGLYLASAAVCCFLIPQVDGLLALTAGPQFLSARICLALMLLSPLHQALGQIQGTLLFAMQETGVYARYGMAVMLASLPLTYFLLAPSSAAVPGLGLGSVGLAAKMVGVQLLGINIQMGLIARIRGWPRRDAFQAAVPAVLVGAAWGSRAIVDLFAAGFSPSARLAASALPYAFLAAAAIWWFPAWTGLTRDQLRLFRSRALRAAEPSA